MCTEEKQLVFYYQKAVQLCCNYAIIQKLKVSLHEPSWVATSVSAWELLCHIHKTGRWEPGANEVHKNPAINFKGDWDSAGWQSQTLFHSQQFKWNFMPLSTTKSVCSWKTQRTWKTSQTQLICIIVFRLPQMSKYMLFSSLKDPAENSSIIWGAQVPTAECAKHKRYSRKKKK